MKIDFSMLYSPQTAKLLHEAQQLSPVPARKQETRRTADENKATGASVKKKPAAAKSGTIPTKKPAAAKSGKNPKPESKSFGTLYLTLATAQSYIQIFDSDSQKKKLLISVTQGMSEKHQEVIQNLALWICSVDNVTREDVINQRKVFLES
jgi:hypothetical protein